MSKKSEEIETVSAEEIEEIEKEKYEEIREPSDEKTSAQHVEYSRGSSKKPYWDTTEVVGANRHLRPAGSFTSNDEVVVRRGFLHKRWAHVQRYWMLYAGAGFIGLAAGLPIL